MTKTFCFENLEIEIYFLFGIWCLLIGICVLLAALWERPVSYQLVGGVMAHQGDDG